MGNLKAGCSFQIRNQWQIQKTIPYKKSSTGNQWAFRNYLQENEWLKAESLENREITSSTAIVNESTQTGTRKSGYKLLKHNSSGILLLTMLYLLSLSKLYYKLEKRVQMPESMRGTFIHICHIGTTAFWIYKLAVLSVATLLQQTVYCISVQEKPQKRDLPSSIFPFWFSHVP